ncbi:hypothetical protein A2673_00945 [Candidatus Kaiserbacteria bacterium RIFCSPHIGHO2_01_FULL_50_13]|nr:MAG: hypothetical protein A2673_00945 [Candidatus Kaiserbacteria bacterium RIFCSPHIGHO2_01_FULL_50_13]
MPEVVNIDLMLVGAAVAGAAMLALVVYVSNSRSATAQALLLYSAVTIGWSLANFISYRLTDEVHILWAIRLVLFFASWHAYAFLLLALEFPNKVNKTKGWALAALAGWTGLVSALVMTPFVYERVIFIGPSSIETSVGWGIIVFGSTVLVYVSAGVVFLAQKLLRTSGVERRQYEFVFAGVAITFFFILTFNFILPAFFNIADLIPFGGLFQLPLIALTAYAILRHHLFNVKIAATALLIFILSVISVSEIIVAEDTAIMVFRIVIFLLILLSGALLIRGVYKEISQRELIEAQEKELELVNREQEALLHFLSHEVKGYLAKGEAGFAAIIDGAYGRVSEGLETMAKLALQEMRAGVGVVMGILDASNLKKGTVSYKKEPFDFKKIVEAIVGEMRTSAEKKGLQLSLTAPEGVYTVMGDDEKLRQHVVRNLIGNSITYTPSGSVSVFLGGKGGRVRMVVEDTGVGISPEDMEKLFTEGGHGQDSIKVNVHSTGFGLYIAKQIVEAHGGKIWAESEGVGKGSRFVIDLPTAA